MALSRFSAALGITLLSVTFHHALACSIIAGPPEVPVQNRFNYLPTTAATPIHLPANASGVVYLTRKTMRKADFLLTEAGTGQRLPVKLTVLQALKPEKMSGPQIPGWADAVTGLRVGPEAGFKPGTAYKIEADEESLHFVIDRAKVDLRSQHVQLSKVGPPNREYSYYEGWCKIGATSRVEVYQASKLLAPPGLMHYRERMYGFVHSPFPTGNPVFEQRPFIRYYLSAIQMGTAEPMPVDGRHSLNVNEDTQQLQGRVMAHYAFFEVDDAWYQTNVLDLAPVPGTIERKDSLDFLRDAMRSKDMQQLRAQLDATPVRGTSFAPAFQRRVSTVRRSETDLSKVSETLADWRYQRRHRALTEALIKLARHPDAAIRTGALGAIGRLMKIAEPDPLATRNTVKALQRTLSDPVPAVRTAASATLAVVTAPAVE
jgi:hypothetical protein